MLLAHALWSAAVAYSAGGGYAGEGQSCDAVNICARGTCPDGMQRVYVTDVFARCSAMAVTRVLRAAQLELIHHRSALFHSSLPHLPCPPSSAPPERSDVYVSVVRLPVGYTYMSHTPQLHPGSLTTTPPRAEGARRRATVARATGAAGLRLIQHRFNSSLSPFPVTQFAQHEGRCRRTRQLTHLARLFRSSSAS